MSTVSEDSVEADRIALVDALVALHADWLVARCERAARRRGLDGSDVYQQAMERLLVASAAVDLGNRGLRTFLGRCIDWAADDLADQVVHDGGVPLEPREFEAALNGGQVIDHHDDCIVTEAFLLDCGLTPHQARAVLNACGSPGLSAKEFAQMVDRRPDAVRKDKERGLAQLRAWLGLGEDESTAFGAVWRSGSVDAAAELLHLPRDEVSALHDSARAKIYCKLLGEESGDCNHVP